MKYRFLASACAVAVALVVAVPAYAFDCTVANKPATAGSAVVVDPTTGDVIASLKPNPGSQDRVHGGFIAFTNGTSTFVHAPQGVLPPVREGGPQDNCDGKGLDAIDVCLGF
jgi:hypothetical protein